MRSTDWQSLRAEPSKQSGFEDLCTQLAASEPPAAGARWTRKGTPDAGIECFWTLSDGKEHGWQAKFFLTALGGSQWVQLEAALKAALEGHPRLTKYTVCLPRNLADGKGRGKSERQKWNDWVKVKASAARRAGRALDIELWDDHALRKRLADERHVGLRTYYFDDSVLTKAKCSRFLQTQKLNAGPRYRPEVHVDAPILQDLLDLVDCERFSSRWHESLRSVVREARRLDCGLGKVFQAELDRVRSDVDAVIAALVRPPVEPSLDSAWLENAQRLVGALHARVTVRLKAFQERSAEAPAAASGAHVFSNPFESATRALYLLEDAVEIAIQRLQDERARIARGVPMLILGEGGSGKTHALMDLAMRHSRDGGVAVVLFGSDLESGDLLRPVNVGLDERFESLGEFLGALNAAGACSRKPALLVIDAVNEAHGSRVLEQSLRSLLSLQPETPWVRIALSHRTPFAAGDPYAQIASNLVRIAHEGLGEALPDAIVEYGRHYGITLSAPPLNPDFQNPLFLDLYARVVQERHGKSFTPGSETLSGILRELLSGVQKRLAERATPGIDPQGRQVELALRALAAATLESGHATLDREQARRIVEQHALAAGAPFERTLFAGLLSERLVIERSHYSHDTEQTVPGIALSWERFGDLLLAEELLQGVKTRAQLRAACRDTGSIASALSNARSVRGGGLGTALSILVAEKLSVELFEFLEQELQLTEEQVFESVFWRDSDAVPKRLSANILDAAIARDSNDRALRLILRLALVHGHPLGIERLHKRLSSIAMAERDLRWSAHVHFSFRHAGHAHPLRFVLAMCWRGADRKTSVADQFAPESAEAALTLLCWLFTSSHRALRDCATKAAVEVLAAHPSLAPRIARKFAAVDDPYVRERVAAMCFGAATRQLDDDHLPPFATALRLLLRSEKDHPTSILLRHFVERGLAFVAARRGVKAAYARPVGHPLTSPPPQLGTVKARFEEGAAQGAARRILHSVTGDDFSHYVARLPIDRLASLVPRAPGGLAPQAVMEGGFGDRWLLDRIRQLAPDLAALDKFDALIQHAGRMEHEQERLGKKYQWIAWRELLARLSDTFTLVRADYWSSDWLGKARVDIDPTLAIRAPASDGWHQPPRCWWKPISYDAWLDHKPPVVWLQTTTDLPDPSRFLLVTNPGDGRRWLSLGGGPLWECASEPHLDSYKSASRRIGLLFFPYLVSTVDADRFMRWAVKENFWGRWMPEGGHAAAFLGEWPCSVRQSDRGSWDKEGRGGSQSPVCPVMAPVRQFLAERGYDYSLAKPVNLDLVVGDVLQGLGAVVSRGDGAMIDRTGRVIAFDPSALEDGPGTALVCCDALSHWLRKTGQTLVWAVVGEKLDCGTNGMPRHGMLEITGAYRWVPSRQEPEGSLRGVFHEPSRQSDS